MTKNRKLTNNEKEKDGAPKKPKKKEEASVILRDSAPSFPVSATEIGNGDMVCLFSEKN